MIRGAWTTFAIIAALMNSWSCSSVRRPNVYVVDIVPRSLSFEHEQDSEPSLAVDRGDPDHMIVTVQTQRWCNDPNGLAPVYQTIDGGQTWTAVFALPVFSGQIASDLSVAASRGHFYAAYLRGNGLSPLRVESLDALFAGGPSKSNSTLLDQQYPGDDQPFVAAVSSDSAERVFVASNYKNAPGKKSATVATSVDGSQPKPIIVEQRDAPDGDAPPVRVAVAGNDSIYAAYLGWRDPSSPAYHGDVVVARDRPNGETIGQFIDLADSNDGKPGARSQTNVELPALDDFENERVGANVALAVDPRRDHAEDVYVAWLERGDPTPYRVQIEMMTKDGWRKVWHVDSAVGFDLAVADNGTVGFLYHQVNEGNWTVHFAQSTNHFKTVASDIVLATTEHSDRLWHRDPLFGDFSRVLAVGSEFRGVFSAGNAYNENIRFQREMDKMNGKPAGTGISIDPFFFSVGVLP